MSSILLSPPAIEPVSLAEAKDYLRVEHDDEDDLIATLIKSACRYVELQTRRALITQSWRIVLDVWPDNGRILILPVPLRELTAARVHRFDAPTQEIDIAAFTADVASAPAALAFASGVLPAPGRYVGGIELDIEAGYGDAAGDVPEPLRHAIRFLVAHWYENRSGEGDDFEICPQTAAALIAPYRVLSL